MTGRETGVTGCGVSVGGELGEGVGRVLGVRVRVDKEPQRVAANWESDWVVRKEWSREVRKE